MYCGKRLIQDEEAQAPWRIFDLIGYLIAGNDGELCEVQSVEWVENVRSNHIILA